MANLSHIQVGKPSLARPTPWRTALVTGASSGIGAALAHRLAEGGTEVVLAARRIELLEATARSIRARRGSARVLELDVTRPDDTVAAIRRVDADVGGLDLVVANAGIGWPQPARSLSWEKMSPLFATNFTGALATLTAVLPEMVRRGRGHLVGISSVAVYGPTPGGSGYRATKAGLTTFLDNLRIELGDSGVHATAVHPGFVRTPFADAFSMQPPMVWSADDAAHFIVRRLPKAPARIDFPFSVVQAMRVLSALPAFLRDRLVRRVRLGPDDE
ncbi:SDR family NAD(P)-dependent oxidoreductase [Pendulispora brunnea]|uniref:SDR family NAD(P)-dependent oxidoreductase n=1 Tax=Pendulispora brunnea TaxID=2905690 RepID=A0ABZ2JUS1_9BACT